MTLWDCTFCLPLSSGAPCIYHVQPYDLQTWTFFMVALVGWMDRQQQDAIAYLKEEKRLPAPPLLAMAARTEHVIAPGAPAGTGVPGLADAVHHPVARLAELGAQVMPNCVGNIESIYSPGRPFRMTSARIHALNAMGCNECNDLSRVRRFGRISLGFAAKTLPLGRQWVTDFAPSCDRRREGPF